VTNDTLTSLVIDGYLAQLDGWTGENHWTWNVIEALVEGRPDLAWPVLLMLVRRAPDRNLAGLAAGPLEDYLARHGARVIDAVEAEAAVNPRLRRALAMVWRQGMPASIWSRIQAIAESDPADRDPRADTSHAGDAADAAGDESWQNRRIELAFETIPPSRPGSMTQADVAARAALIAGVRAELRGQRGAWSTPVAVELVLETGEMPLDAPALDVLAAVVAALVDAACIAEAALVRQARLTEIRSRAVGYRLTVIRMSEEQVGAIEDPRGLDELLLDPETAAFMAEMGVEWPVPGSGDDLR